MSMRGSQIGFGPRKRSRQRQRKASLPGGGNGDVGGSSSARDPHDPQLSDPGQTTEIQGTSALERQRFTRPGAASPDHRPPGMVAMMMSLEAAARALGGDIRNGEVVCPGP